MQGVGESNTEKDRSLHPTLADVSRDLFLKLHWAGRKDSIFGSYFLADCIARSTDIHRCWWDLAGKTLSTWARLESYFQQGMPVLFFVFVFIL